MADAKLDLSYTPPPAAELRAEALRRAIEREPEKNEGEGWFSKPTAAELAVQGMFLALGLTDWGQTTNFTQHKKRQYEEVNPILGKHPSRAKVNTLIPLGLAAHTLSAYALPRPYRHILQGLGLAGEGIAVANNTSRGISPVLPWK